jgi:CRISPR-associated protein Cst2
VLKLNSLSLSARVTFDLHNLNSEGTEGNQQQTRMVHIVDEAGERQIVNAISGDMFKHIFVGHLTPLLERDGQPLSSGARQLNPDRVNADPEFKKTIKDLEGGSAVLAAIAKQCAVTDIAGALITEGRAVARKSCVEFGWVVGLPEKTVTEQYFHVKYDPESRSGATGQEGKGEGTVAGRQAIFHRPANSGIYALICNIELGRIGVNDITRRLEISMDDQLVRARAAVRALMATLLCPAGAQRNTQNPHIVACEGVVATSKSSLPAPTVSPLNHEYGSQIEKIAGTLNGIQSDTVKVHRFGTLAEAAAVLENIATEA